MQLVHKLIDHRGPTDRGKLGFVDGTLASCLCANAQLAHSAQSYDPIAYSL
jgi:hypothetical protein